MTAPAPLATLHRSADGRIAAAVLRCASDVALVVGRDGAIREIHIAPELRGTLHVVPGAAARDIVRPEDRAALASALAAAAAGRIPEPFEVRHAGRRSDAVLRYAALPADAEGDILLIGRLLQRIDALAQRVSETQLGGGGLAHRATEARYQMLFEGAAEAILLVGSASGIVDEANPRALTLLGLCAAEVVGRPFAELVSEADRGRIAGLIEAAAERGEIPELRLTLVHSCRSVSLYGRAFRAFDKGQLMLCLDPLGGADRLAPADALVARLLRGAGEAVALTDASGGIIWASDAFPRPDGDPAEGLVGRSVAEVLEGAGTVLRSALNAAREHGRVSCPGVAMPAAAGEVRGELTVVALAGDAPAGFGIFFRPDADGATETPDGQATAEAEEIAVIVGQAPLKSLVRDASDAIERSCIDAALRLTGGNKAAAAEVLGLSRQSLYLKLHRFGLL